MNKAKTKKTIIIAIVAVLVAAAIAVTTILLINKKRDDELYDPYDENPETVEFDENYIVPEEAEELFELDYVEPTPIAHNKKLDKPVKADMSAFIAELSGKEIEFEYAEYYDSAKHIKDQKPLAKVEQHKYDVTDGTGVVDEDALYEIIKKNNDEYFEHFKNQKDDINADVQLFEASPKKDIKQACHYIAEYVNKAKESGEWKEIDFDRVYCNLATLKVMHGISGGFSLAYVDENNILSINPEIIENSTTLAINDSDMLEKMSKKEQEQFVWDTTLVHEIMHLLQDSCPCIEDDDAFLLGNMYLKDEDATHPMFDFWYAEASAELGMSKTLGVEPVTYPGFINYYYSLLSAYYLDPSISPKKIMHLTYDGDCYPFYKAFGELNDKEIEELVNAMYTVEVMANTPDGFYEWYENKNGVKLREREDEDELVKQKLRVEALKCFTKHYYISLAKQVEQGKMSYNDMFYLIRLYERALFEHLMYNDEDRAMTSNIFFDDYLSVQDAFFGALADNNISKDELISEFEKYTAKCKDGKKTKDNFSLDWMNKEQKYALEKIEGNYVFINLPTIRSAKALYVENGYDKSVKY